MGIGRGKAPNASLGGMVRERHVTHFMFHAFNRRPVPRFHCKKGQSSPDLLWRLTKPLAHLS